MSAFGGKADLKAEVKFRELRKQWFHRQCRAAQCAANHPLLFSAQSFPDPAGTHRAQPNNKRDEAQHPTTAPRNPF
jgi:hypothetical protein